MAFDLTSTEQSITFFALPAHIKALRDRLQVHITASVLDVEHVDWAVNTAARIRRAEHLYRRLAQGSVPYLVDDACLPAVYRTPPVHKAAA